jgi:hypothetical protein
MRSLIGIDSNSLTYLVEAIEPRYEPRADDPNIAAERIAMLRTYLYAGVQFWVSPTVAREYNRIRQPSKHLKHQRTAFILLNDSPPSTLGTDVQRRAKELEAFHVGKSD